MYTSTCKSTRNDLLTISIRFDLNFFSPVSLDSGIIHYDLLLYIYVLIIWNLSLKIEGSSSFLMACTIFICTSQ